MAKRKDIYNLFDEMTVGEAKSLGKNGDTELIHATPPEVAILKALGGVGTINSGTQLRQFHLPNQSLLVGDNYQHQLLYARQMNEMHGETDKYNYGTRDWDTGGAKHDTFHSDYGEGDAWKVGYQKSEFEEVEDTAAGLLSYDDYKQFLDPTTGKISDAEGMMNFLKNNKQIQDLGYTEEADIYKLMQGMPSLGIDPYDLRTGQATYQAGLGGMSQDIQAESRKTSSERIASGVTSPASGGDGLGYLSSKELNPYMQQGMQFAQEKGNVYGLGQPSSDELVSWIGSLPMQGE